MLKHYNFSLSVGFDCELELSVKNLFHLDVYNRCKSFLPHFVLFQGWLGASIVLS